MIFGKINFSMIEEICRKGIVKNPPKPETIIWAIDPWREESHLICLFDDRHFAEVVRIRCVWKLPNVEARIRALWHGTWSQPSGICYFFLRKGVEGKFQIFKGITG
jgi:hypothetical protein